MNCIDFSCKHDILLEAPDGSLQPMDQPYFRSEKIAEGTWLIRSDGDFSYLLEADREAFMIDSGYGAGNIREYAQTLTDRPVRCIANTHDHFDHTANNSYFEKAYMSAETEPLATVPFQSFSGIDFPRDYPKVILKDGDTIPLEGRPLQAFEIPDHAVGSMVYLDRKARILFSGDEFMMPHKSLNGTVQHWHDCMKKLEPYRSEYDQIWGGGGRVRSDAVELYLRMTEEILGGAMGEVEEKPKFPHFDRTLEDGRKVWKRFLPHPGDGPTDWDIPEEEKAFHRVLTADGVSLGFDSRRIR